MHTRVTHEIREYLVRTWLSGDARGFDDDTDLQQSGILDSFATLALIGFLDEHFHACIEPSDVNSETFRTVRMLSKLVVEKMPR